nr:hypothetical protein [Tanacetum cinerariifolium]
MADRGVGYACTVTWNGGEESSFVHNEGSIRHMLKRVSVALQTVGFHDYCQGECSSRAFGQEKGQPQLGSLMPKGLSHEVEWSPG